MMKKTIVWLMLTLLIASMLMMLNMELVKADPGVIRVPEDFSTIKGAIDAANEGDTIIVSEGEYREGRINVYKRLTLMANGTVIVDGLLQVRRVLDVTADNVTIKGFTVKNSSYAGIYLDGVENCMIEGNIATDNFGAGIALYGSEGNNVSGNIVANNSYYGIGGYGIVLYYSYGNDITGNIETNSGYYGILLWYSNGNNIVGNIATNNDYHGIRLHDSDSNNVSGNIATNNRFGIRLLAGSEGNDIFGNIVTNNGFGIRIKDSNGNNIVGNNATNNIWTGIVLLRCDGYNISGNNASNNMWGIELGASNGNTISGNIATANPYDGIDLDVSDNNTIDGNKAINNGRGIALKNCDGNTISGNIATANGRGIMLKACDSNNISGNTVTDSTYGILLDDSNHTNVYHNNFINNTEQVSLIESFSNIWDDGYPSGGNYWSDYEERYPDAKELDGSGIWDTPYEIDENNQDNYPLMKPWGMPPGMSADLVKHKARPEHHHFVLSRDGDPLVDDRHGTPGYQTLYSMVKNTGNVTIPAGTYKVLWNISDSTGSSRIVETVGTVDLALGQTTVLTYDVLATDLAPGKYYVGVRCYHYYAMEGEKIKTFSFTVVS